MEHVQQVLVFVGTVVVMLSALIPTLQVLAGVLAKLSLLTATKVDDQAVSKLSNVLSFTADAVAQVERGLPRAALGKLEPVVQATIAAAQIQNNSIKPPAP